MGLWALGLILLHPSHLFSQCSEQHSGILKVSCGFCFHWWCRCWGPLLSRDILLGQFFCMNILKNNICCLHKEGLSLERALTPQHSHCSGRFQQCCAHFLGSILSFPNQSQFCCCWWRCISQGHHHHQGCCQPRQGFTVEMWRKRSCKDTLLVSFSFFLSFSIALQVTEKLTPVCSAVVFVEQHLKLYTSSEFTLPGNFLVSWGKWGWKPEKQQNNYCLMLYFGLISCCWGWPRPRDNKCGRQLEEIWFGTTLVFTATVPDLFKLCYSRGWKSKIPTESRNHID